MNEEKYITIKELAELKGVSPRAIRLSKGKYITREITVKGGKSFEILLSSIERELQEKYYSKILPTYSEKLLPISTDFHKPDKAKVIALARLDLLNLWKNERKNQSNKTKFDDDFLSAYNAQVLYPEIYAKIGKVFGDIYITLVYNQPLDGNNASEYCRTNVDVLLGSIDTEGKYKKQVPLDTPDCAGNFEKILIEHGYKWAPVKVYKRSIPKGVNAINWRLNVGVITRSQFELDEPQDATIIVTISDPSEMLPVYNDFVVASRTKGWITNALRVNNRLRPQQ